jgi:cbb3-type cytochrome oxidase subunit 3
MIVNLILSVESLGDDFVAAGYQFYYTYWLILFFVGVLIIIWERRSKNQED